MPSLRDLANNISSFNYYSGRGNFSQNNIPYGDNKPSITYPVGFRWSPANFDDGIVPFGAITRATRTMYDVGRVSAFLYGKTAGNLFLAKQTGLQLTNVEIEHPGELKTDRPQSGQGFIRNITNTIGNFANKVTNDYGPTRIFNPLGASILAQVGANAVGGRFTRHGALPIQAGTSDREDYYMKYVLNKDQESRGKNNRLYLLSVRLSDEKDPNILQIAKYKGGQGSSFGIGDTVIRRYSTSMLYSSLRDDSGFVSIPIKNLTSFVKEGSPELGTIGRTADSENGLLLGKNIDFRGVKNTKLIVDGSNQQKQPSSNYAKNNIEDRIGISRSRTPSERLNSKEKYNTYDKVNALGLFYNDRNLNSLEAGTTKTKDINGEDVTSKTIRDIIKFRIASVDNDNPTKSVYMVFRSYINSIKRSVTPKWNAYTYVGRGESFYLYDGFTEQVNISFTIAASSQYEMKPLYQKLNYLISTLTPDYAGDTRMRGNLAELTIGDFIKYQPGIITSLDMVVDEEINWEIAIDEPEGGGDKDMHELPQMIKCSMGFIPIYNFLPRKTHKRPFIGIDDTEGGAQGAKNWLNTTNTDFTSKK